jgi:hypothetical protein
MGSDTRPCRRPYIFGSAGVGIGGVLPIGTALVTEFAPRRIRATMIVMGVPRRRCPERTEPLNRGCGSSDQASRSPKFR